MATITRLPFLRHLRASATSHVQHLSAGQVRHSAPGASFWFRPLTAAISEVGPGQYRASVTMPLAGQQFFRVGALK